jgi:hypothetical protein
MFYNILVRRRFPFFAEERVVDNGRIRTYDLCIFIPVYPPGGDYLFAQLPIQGTQNGELMVQTGNAGSVVKSKLN